MRIKTAARTDRRLQCAAAAAVAAGLSLGATPALAQTQAAGADAPIPTNPAPNAGPSSNSVVNLIRLLVKQGVITQSAADDLVRQAETEAVEARRVDAQLAAAAPPAALPAPGDGVLRVPYVPQFVKDQIRDEVRDSVLDRARNEGWAAPGSLPAWLSRIEFSGDFRVRDQFDLYDNGNTNELIDYPTFNAGSGTDINDLTNPGGIPFLNTRQNRRNTLSLRARLNVKAKLSDFASVNLRLATGRDNSPVSTTQTLGGGFGKKDIWLDQAYLSLHAGSWAGLTLGRMPNPFVHTDILFSDNLNLDGAAGTLTLPPGAGSLKAFATAGAFPISYVGGSFPTNSADKSPDQTQWLFAAQLGAEWKPSDAARGRLTVAYYDFQDLRGKQSAPCALYAGVRQCSSDLTRASFMQKGNTLFLLRDIAANPASPFNYAQPQFVGLTYDYNVLDVVADMDVRFIGERRLGFQGNYTRNLAYDAKQAIKGAGFNPVNNYEAAVTGLGPYRSGGTAWMAKASLGDNPMAFRGNWTFAAGYKYIEPDAVLDGFNDNDFHLGGTNARGYFLTGSYGLFEGVLLTGRWLSAREVYGPPLAIDVLQLELNTSF